MSGLNFDVHVGYLWLLEENTNVFTLSSSDFFSWIRMSSLELGINIPKKFKIILASIMW